VGRPISAWSNIGPIRLLLQRVIPNTQPLASQLRSLVGGRRDRNQGRQYRIETKLGILHQTQKGLEFSLSKAAREEVAVGLTSDVKGDDPLVSTFICYAVSYYRPRYSQSQQLLS
jgi:hypothetical protein